MYLLYSLIFLMLLSAILLLSIPFILTQNLLSQSFLFSSFFIIIVSLSLFFSTENYDGLKYWLTIGEAHYRLQQEIKNLGGLSGMIKQIKLKLAADPNDAEGWFILGKLYLANQDPA